MDNKKIIIIGAGIVGLATAYKLYLHKPNLKIIVLEKENEVASHQTGNNSGVIHAGVYYKPGSYKAVNCISGYKQLIEFCNKEDINYDLCGKLIIATKSDELPYLDNLYQRSIQNGLNKVIKIPKEQIQDFEPYATGIKALYVPYTGIVDYKLVANKYYEIIVDRFGGQIFLNHKAIDIRHSMGNINVITKNKTFVSDIVINTAGLQSDKIAKITDNKSKIRIIPFRGEYVELIPQKNYLIKNLIYPVPNPNFPFLGVHFTRMINGGIEAGPNAVWAFSREGYKFRNINPYNMMGDLAWPGFRKVMKQYWKTGLGEYYRSFNKKALLKAMQKLVPEISIADFKSSGAGVRAQACDRMGGLADDFIITQKERIINVLNAPSPAATASLAIGETIAGIALKQLGLS